MPGGSCLVPLCPTLCGHAGGRCHTLEHRTKCRAVTCMNGSQKSTTDQPQNRARAVEVQHNKREPASRSRGSLGTRGFSLLHTTTGTGTYARETNVPHDGTIYLSASRLRRPCSVTRIELGGFPRSDSNREQKGLHYFHGVRSARHRQNDRPASRPARVGRRAHGRPAWQTTDVVRVRSAAVVEVGPRVHRREQRSGHRREEGLWSSPVLAGSNLLLLLLLRPR